MEETDQGVDEFNETYGRRSGHHLECLQYFKQKENKMKRRMSFSVCLAISMLLVSCISVDMSKVSEVDRDPDRLTRKYIKELRHGNGVQRMKAAWELGKAPVKRFPEIIPLLVETLKDPHPKVRANAAGALSKLGMEATAAKSALKEALNDPYGRVVNNSAIALSKMGTPYDQLIPAVRRVLNDQNGTFRVDAVSQLRTMGISDKEVMPVLISVLSDPDVKARKRAMKELAEIRYLPRSTIPYIIAALKDQDEIVRFKAVLLLHHNYGKPPAEALHPLIEALYDPSDAVVRFSIGALGVYGKAAKKAVPKLLEILETGPDDQVRTETAETLGEIGTPKKKIAPALVQVLSSDPHWVVRLRAADALGKLGYKDQLVITTLKKAATHGENPAIKNAAANALRKLGVN